MRFIMVSNQIFGFSLSASELQVYVCLKRHCNRENRAVVRANAIARQCSIKSLTTVYNAISALCDKGLIEKRNRYNAQGEYLANEYIFKRFDGGFFRVPHLIFTYALPKTAFKLYLYLLKCSGKDRISWPSLTQIHKITGISRKAACQAIRLLHDMKLCIKERRQSKVNRALIHNRYTVERIQCGLFAQLCRAALISAPTRKRRSKSVRRQINKSHIVWGNDPIAFKAKKWRFGQQIWHWTWLLITGGP